MFATDPASSRASAHVSSSIKASFSTDCRIYLATAIAFLVTVSLTTYFARSMAGGMPMPGHWTMSMMWMRVPGQGCLGAAVVLVGMWQAMMIAMMLPSMLPTLLLYRRVVRFRGEASVALLTILLAAGYFSVWLGFGRPAFANVTT